MNFEFEELNSLLKESVVSQHQQVEIEQFYGNSLAMTEVRMVGGYHCKIVD